MSARKEPRTAEGSVRSLLWGRLSAHGNEGPLSRSVDAPTLADVFTPLMVVPLMLAGTTSRVVALHLSNPLLTRVATSTV